MRKSRSNDTRLNDVLVSIVGRMRAQTDRGIVADYIPELATADPAGFGIALSFADGSWAAAGDCKARFSIQSIAKIFTLTLAIGKMGDQLWDRVGREPSGSPFNSIVQLEYERGIPRNPFINAGALVVADCNLAGHTPKESIGEMLQFIRFLAEDENIIVNEDVARSELALSDRNRALAHYIASSGNLKHPVDHVIGTYVHQCAIEVDCHQLAAIGRFLMLGGLHPSGNRVISALRARRILSLMLTCGLYDASGDFAFRVGIPAKSGVGGAILAIVPGVVSVAVWSPGLDRAGNSKLGTDALAELVAVQGWSVFDERPQYWNS